MNKNNLDIAKHDRLNVIGYPNGEGQTKYLDLKDIDRLVEKHPQLWIQ
jgi:hypothetical protein